MGGKIIPRFFLDLLVIFCTPGNIWVMAVEKYGQDIQAIFTQSREEEKIKIFCHCTVRGELSASRDPTKGHVEGFKPTKSIRNTPQGTEKALLRDRQQNTHIERQLDLYTRRYSAKEVGHQSH